MRRDDKGKESVARRLLLLKRAMTETSLRMNSEAEKAPAVETCDKLGCTIKALRALDRGRWDILQDVLKELPGLNEKLTLADVQEGMASLRRVERFDRDSCQRI